MFLSPIIHKDQIIPEEYYVVTSMGSGEEEPFTTIETGKSILDNIQGVGEDEYDLIGWHEDTFCLWSKSDDEENPEPIYNMSGFIRIHLINQYIKVDEPEN